MENVAEVSLPFVAYTSPRVMLLGVSPPSLSVLPNVDAVLFLPLGNMLNVMSLRGAPDIPSTA